MNALRRLWRLRRQDDRVKLALLFLLLAAVLLGYGVAGAAEYGALLRQPVEYVAVSVQTGPGLDAVIARLREREDIVCASRERSYSLVAGEKTLNVTELDSAYLSACYGIEGEGDARRFWLGSGAYGAFVGNGTESPAELSFTLGETESRGAFYRADALPESFAVSCGVSRTLSESGTVRVMFRRTDPSGADAASLVSMGFTIQNTEEMVSRGYEAELLLTRLGFSLLSAALSALLGRVYWKTRRVRTA